MKSSLILCLLFSLPLFAQVAPPAKELSLEACAALIKEKPELVVIDVRTPGEFADGHITGATNINVFAESFGAQIAGLDKKSPYLLHCAAGVRSTKARRQMQAAGFTNLYHMTKGFKPGKWADLGEKVAK